MGKVLSENIPTVSRAKESEKKEILSLYQSVIGSPFCVWNDEYPTMFEIENDLSAGTLFVMKQGEKIIGAVSLVPEQELCDFPFWKGETPAEIARLVISPDFQGKGLSRILLQKAEWEAKLRGALSIRLLAVKNNLPAVTLYRHEGYQTCGEVSAYGHEYYAMERIISDGAHKKID